MVVFSLYPDSFSLNDQENYQLGYFKIPSNCSKPFKRPDENVGSYLR